MQFQRIPNCSLISVAATLYFACGSAYATADQFCNGFTKGYVEGWNGEWVVGIDGDLHKISRQENGRRETPPIPACKIELGDNDDNSTLSSFEQGEKKGAQRGIKGYKDDLGSGSQTDKARTNAAAAKAELEAKAQANAAAKAKVDEAAAAKTAADAKRAAALEAEAQAKRQLDADSRPPSPARLSPQAQITLSQVCTDRYPSVSRRLNEQGVVTVKLRVTDQGKVSDVQIVQSSAFARLDEAMLHCVKDSKLSIEPAAVDGHPVESWQLLTYRWALGSAR